MIKKAAFPVDGQLLMVLPRASASTRNPDVTLPLLRGDDSGYYLEMRVEPDPQESSEVALTRRVPLNDLTKSEWVQLQKQYEELDFSVCRHQGLNKVLEKIPDQRIQRLFVALLTFLNPRQVGIVLYLYKEAAQQGNGPIVSFRSNELLESLGYTRSEDGGFTARVRSQLNQDLVALHRTELVFAKSLVNGDQLGAKVQIKNILRIRDYEIDNVPRDFDLAKAADYTYELADAYTISLEFFEGPSRTGDYVLFPAQLEAQQKVGVSAKQDYRLKLLVYLASRLKWDKPTDGEYLSISKRCLFKNLDLLGSNKSRSSQILWRTIETLREENFVLEAQELPGKRKSVAMIQFRINPEKLTTSLI